ncbi:hypothetical protein LRAMOSA08261 [Lichtheimia ramosa]|uniref:Defective in cullin neddylation protein n=1 Tax=Lichtheimia ramosa TaxID=688394 RepID=A0A077WF38_9FUNG|nr:hypothetical protein LRAMOSA08261 [Lichtheimia ramosa]
MSLKRKFQPTYFENTITMGAKQSNMSATQKQHQHPAQKRAKPRSSSTASNTTRHGNKPIQPVVNPVPQFDEQQCRLLFKKYADPDTPDTISPEGMQRFFEDLGLSVEDVLVIAFAWKMNLQTMGYITENEWMQGMRELGTDSLEKLQAKRPELENALNDAEQMKDMYRYTFGYAKNKDQKCMDVEVASALWSMLLGSKFPIVNDFLTFLQEKCPVRVVNRDQWQSFLEFAATVSPDLSEYDETSAWPVLFDEYVEWKREQA